MKYFTQYILEKLHLDKDIEINNNYSDIEYILTAPDNCGLDEKYILCKDNNTTSNNFYIFSFNDLIKISKENDFYSGYYVYKFNRKYIDSIDDIKNGNKLVERRDVFILDTGDTIQGYINKKGR